MKYLILALLAATFSLASTAEAGITIHCGSGDPMKGLNLTKSGGGGGGGKLCPGAGRVKSPATEKPSVEGGKNDGDKAITFGRDQLKGSTKSNTSDRGVNNSKSNSY